jgi:hypothetical protein
MAQFEYVKKAILPRDAMKVLTAVVAKCGISVANWLAE